MSRWVALILYGWIGLGLFGCSINPVTGERELVFMSPEREAALGAQAAVSVENQIGLVADPDLSNYVATLGQRLAAYSPRTDVPYRFFVADMPEPNAFALPGGYIYVSRGLLILSNSEAELANVLGHEIGHVAARHAAQRETRSIGVNLLTVLGTVAAAVTGGAEAAQTVQQIGQAAGAGLIASYGRDQERQSDEIGQTLAAQSGWDPQQMANFFTSLQRETVLRTGSQPRPSYLDSHPMLDERAQSANARARALVIAPVPPVADGRAAFLQRMEGLLVGPDPAEGVFLEQVFVHAGLDIHLEFPAEWRTQNQKTAVVAMSPRQDALIALEMQGPSGDPAAAARAFAEANKVQLVNPQSGQIGGFAAFHAVTEAQTQQGNVALDLTWIAHPAGIFRITGTTPSQNYRAYAQTFSASAGSLRSLEDAERARIREQRLHVAFARAGERIDAFSARTGNVWSAEETAVVNGLAADAGLPAGYPMKIAIERPFRP